MAGAVLTCFGAVIAVGDAFAPHRWLPIPMLVLVLGGGLVMALLPFRVNTRILRGYFSGADLMLVGFIILVAGGVVLSGAAQGKNLNHAIAYTSVVLAFGLGLRFLLALDGAGLAVRDRLLAVISSSTFVVSAFAVFEFLDVNFLHLGIAGLVPFPSLTGPYNPQFFIFTRARGFEAESGFLALFLNTFAPVGYLVARDRLGKGASLVFLGCSVGAFLVTFSVAGLAALACGILVATMIFIWDRRIVRVAVRHVAVGLALLGLLSIAALQAPQEVRSSIWAKLSLASGFSVGERVRAWEEAVVVARAHPMLGVGVGRTSAETGTGVISFYLTMLKEAGTPALLLILGYFAWAFTQVLRLSAREPLKYMLAAGLVAAVVHYAVIANIWYPWLWLLIALIVNERVRQRAIGPRALPDLSPSRNPALQLR